jgi:hypothetical protein
MFCERKTESTMLIAMITDLHANLEALQACLACR